MSLRAPDATQPQMDNLKIVPGAQSKVVPANLYFLLFPATASSLHPVLGAEAEKCNPHAMDIGTISTTPRYGGNSGDGGGDSGPCNDYGGDYGNDISVVDGAVVMIVVMTTVVVVVIMMPTRVVMVVLIQVIKAVAGIVVMMVMIDDDDR